MSIYDDPDWLDKVLQEFENSGVKVPSTTLYPTTPSTTVPSTTPSTTIEENISFLSSIENNFTLFGNYSTIIIIAIITSSIIIWSLNLRKKF